MSEMSSGTIALSVTPQANGRYLCEVRPSSEIGGGTMKGFPGQTAKHAIANALENLAGALRKEAEAGQNVEWDSADRSPSGTVSNKRFHVILHYERLVEEESKFEAMHNTMLGNSVVENGEITIIQVDRDFPKLAWKSRFEE
jgi:hypothetical protein